MSESYYVLEIRDPDGDAERYEISEPEVHLGRSQAKADIVVPDTKASGRHCRLGFDGYAVTVSDLGSTNGTWFDGEKVRDLSLTPGRHFAIGDSQIRLVAIHRPAPPPSEELEATRALSLEQLEGLAGPDESTKMIDASMVPGGHRPPSVIVAPPPPATANLPPTMALQPPSESDYPAPPPTVQRTPESLGLTPTSPSGFDSGPTGPSGVPDGWGQPSNGGQWDLPADGADRTMAFDRASIRIGERDTSVSRPRRAVPADPPPRRASGGVRALGGFLALLAIATGVLVSLGGSEPELDSVDGPGADAVKAAGIAWKGAASASLLGTLVGGDELANIEAHYKKAVEAYAEFSDDDTSPSERAEALQTLTESSGYAVGTAGTFLDGWARAQRGLWIASGVALLAGLLMVFGIQRIGGGLGVVAIAGPLAMGQPYAPIAMIAAGLFTLLALIGLGLSFRR